MRYVEGTHAVPFADLPVNLFTPQFSTAYSHEEFAAFSGIFWLAMNETAAQLRLLFIA